MKFRTEIDAPPLGVKIGYHNHLLALGSCFAENIAGELTRAKFQITANPSGILFNPLSIAAAIASYAAKRSITSDDLAFDGEVWYNYDFHGSLSAPTADQALEGMNSALETGAQALENADRVLLTFGTAWIYEHDGHVVANCHRRSSTEFVRRRIGIDEIVDTFGELLAGPLRGKEILLTVSPVRHLGDGLEGNAVSKATLRLAVEELTAAYSNVHYFPAYEILCDDLRDYRFYADDLTHPSAQAVRYVWEKFVESALDPEARRLLPAVERITAAAAHLPRNPQSEAFRTFCCAQLREIEQLSGIDFQAEKCYFNRCLEINL